MRRRSRPRARPCGLRSALALPSSTSPASGAHSLSRDADPSLSVSRSTSADRGDDRLSRSGRRGPTGTDRERRVVAQGEGTMDGPGVGAGVVEEERDVVVSPARCRTPARPRAARSAHPSRAWLPGVPSPLDRPEAGVAVDRRTVARPETSARGGALVAGEAHDELSRSSDAPSPRLLLRNPWREAGASASLRIEPVAGVVPARWAPDDDLGAGPRTSGIQARSGGRRWSANDPAGS